MIGILYSVFEINQSAYHNMDAEDASQVEASAQRLQRIEMLRYLCRAYVHHTPVNSLRQLAKLYGVQIPPGEPDPKLYMCRALADMLEIDLPDEVITAGRSVPVDHALLSAPGCSLRIVRSVGEDLLGSAGIIYVVEGFADCLGRTSDESYGRYAVVKTVWARDSLRWSQTRTVYGRLLQEQYTMFVTSMDARARNLVPSYDMWAGPEGKASHALGAIKNPYILIPYYAQGDLLQWFCETMRLDTFMPRTSAVGHPRLDVHSAVCLLSSIFIQMAQGMLSLHRQGYLHCDFKTENCLVSLTGLSDAQEAHFQRMAKTGSDEIHSLLWTRQGTPQTSMTEVPLWPVVHVADFDMSCGVMLEEQTYARISKKEAYDLAGVLSDRGASPSELDDAAVNDILVEYVRHVLTTQYMNIGARPISPDTLSEQQKNAVLQGAVQRMTAARKSVKWALKRAAYQAHGPELMRSIMNSMCFVGTDSYLAPELSRPPIYRCRTRTLETDAWALGATMLTLCSCSTQVKSGLLEQYDGRVTKTAHRSSVLHTVEAKALRDVINGLMRADPKDRLMPVDVVEHPTLREYASRVFERARPAILRHA